MLSFGSMRNSSPYRGFILLLLAQCFLFGFSISTFAQDETGAQNRIFKTKMRASSASELMAGKIAVHLWGIESIAAALPAFKLKARGELADVVADGDVECEIKRRDVSGIFAQCQNATGLDLGLYMIQQGYASVDRTAVYGSVFEDVYVQAEREAQQKNMGIWAHGSGGADGGSGLNGSVLLMIGGAFLLGVITVIGALSFVMKRGFQKLLDAQQVNTDLMMKERKLKDKERSIVATMIDTELKANKSKIEAYLVVYEEMLNALKDPERPPKYKKAGDIVQAQPVLSRAIFDRNNDKLDVLGHELSSDLVHFYARIKTNPDYQNLEPDMSLDKAIELVAEAVYSAQRMNDLADNLIEAFERSGVTRERSMP